jgi:VIT1/CCC1 family predicted Fe2+/Mn2+ transporter
LPFPVFGKTPLACNQVRDENSLMGYVGSLHESGPARSDRGATIVSPLTYLKPNESLSVFIAALIVVLSSTLAASTVSDGQEGASAALIAAIGVNAAWGLVNAVLYMMGRTFDSNRRLRLGRAIASAPDETAAVAAIGGELDPSLASVTQVEDRDWLYRSIRISMVHGRLPPRIGSLRHNAFGAIEVFCVALAASFPAVLPLLLFGDPWLALRISNLVVVGLLFLAGYYWARYVHANPWLTGFGLTGIGLALVAVATLLGG